LLRSVREDRIRSSHALEDFERRDQSKLLRFDALALRDGPNEVAMSEAPMMLIAAN
jgi:hypothetical protein